MCLFKKNSIFGNNLKKSSRLEIKTEQGLLHFGARPKKSGPNKCCNEIQEP